MCLFEFVRRVNANIGKNMKTKMKMIEMCVWKCVYVWMNVCITIVVNGYVLWILALSLIYRFYRKRHFLINICFAIFAHSFLFRLCPLLLLLLFLFFFIFLLAIEVAFPYRKIVLLHIHLVHIAIGINECVNWCRNRNISHTPFKHHRYFNISEQFHNANGARARARPKRAHHHM